MAAKTSRPITSKTPLHRHLSDVAAYPPGKPTEEVEREYGLTDVVKLASNENPLGPSPRAIQAMAESAEEMNLYPDGGGFYLKRELAKRLSVTPEEIVLGNGSDEITTFLALCYLGPRRGIVTSDYAFVRYRMAAEMVNAPVTLIPMKRFRHDTEAMARAVTRSTVMVLLDNPCNPTGAMTTRRELTRLLRSVPPRVLVIVDEAYYEYACGDENYPDTLALRRKHPNLIVTRTFSKAHGLAGLRIGYSVARAAIIADLDRVRGPFNTNRMAQAAAIAALKDRAHVRKSVGVNERGKRFLAKAFERMGLKWMPTWGNFFLVDFSSTGRTGIEIYEELLRRGVIVRPMGGYGLIDHTRISVGTPEDNRTLAAALRDVLG